MEEINDNEIRIIGQSSPYRPNPMPEHPTVCSMKRNSRNVPRRRHRVLWILLIIFLIIAIFLSVIIYSSDYCRNRDKENIEALNDGQSLENQSFRKSDTNENIIENKLDNRSSNYCNISRIIVNDVPLKILDPGNAVPEFHIGKLDTSDSELILACQAADIREDNGGIVGACICRGEIVGRGLSKAGFVAIINGNIKIGAELNSPYFEEAIQSNGDFFRQYPLIKDGLLIENNLNNKSIRRALCEYQGRMVVFESESRESFHDFSQAMIDQGVQNAVYLVGSSDAHGFCRPAPDAVEEWGNPSVDTQKNVTYLIWKK